ncbi:MAG: hypothetical protein H6719_24565 [Sandaracinaceae bacterium]|nr:hypothetical protein [Sandaracinaceae bacterium]
MTYAISVPTPFNDISELAESFYSRVDEERIMLPNPDAIPEGEWVQFHVTLADGSAALQGQGRCTGSYDNGEERAAEHRFDVVMDSLQLDEMGQIYFERILQVRAAYAGDEPQTGETQVPDEYAAASEEEAVAYAEEPAEEAAEYTEVADESFGGFAEEPVEADEYAAAPVELAEAPVEEEEALADDFAYAAEAPVEEFSFDDEPAEVEAVEAYVSEPAPAAAEVDASEWEEPSGATELGSIEEYIEAPVLATPATSRIYDLPPPTTPDPLPSPHAVAEALTRPVLHASWSPEPLPRPEPSASSGHFQYAMGAGLPQPPEPPRPDLDPSMRVAPAPRAGDPHAGAVFAQAVEGGEYAEAGYAEAGYAEAGYAEAGYAEAEVQAGYSEEEYEAEEGYADTTAHEGSEEEAYEGEESWDDEEEDGGEYEASDYSAYGEDSTLDAEGYVAGGQEETRQVDLTGLPEDIEIGDETMQVELPEES